MRLGQLARKLALRPSQIVDYLATQQIFPDEGSNARLNDEVTRRVILHFAPARLNEIMAMEENTPEPVETPAPGKKESVAVDSEEVTMEVAPPHVIAEEKSVVEVIKAPKVELSGLKVLGKIELPEPKKKLVPVAESPEGVIESPEGVAEKIPATERKSRRAEPRNKNQQRTPDYKQRPERNPIAVQREQKAREEEEKRKIKQEREKEKRTQYYMQRVKAGQPTKAVKIVTEPTESMILQEERPAPKTWFGKFLRWLNT